MAFIFPAGYYLKASKPKSPKRNFAGVRSRFVSLYCIGLYVQYVILHMRTCMCVDGLTYVHVCVQYMYACIFSQSNMFCKYIL